jgi:hypothetical protein
VPKSGLYPRGGPRPTTSRGEQVMYRALSTGLPGGWTAWHSLRVRADATLEGEGDFVVAVSSRGVMVIEVKGGAIEVRDGIWLQNGAPLKVAPREQALHFAKKLRAQLEQRGEPPIPWVAVATAFPETPFSTGPSHGDVAGAVLGQQDLGYLDEALPALADRVFDGIRPIKDTKWVDTLHSIWGETWAPRLTLGDRTKLRQGELVPLDREQIDLLDHIDVNDRMIVRGGPGTGKTLLAIEMVKRFTARAKRPVFLCFTRALARAVRAEGHAESWTVRELAASLLARAKIPMQGGAPSSAWSPDTWNLASLQAAADAVPVLGQIYDAVVVDEAQDFASSDWDLVRALAGSGPIWAFGDDGQGFWNDRDRPSDLLLASFTLTHRYRCPEPLAAFADQYRPGWKGTAIDRPIDELRIVRAPSASAISEKVGLEIQKAMGDGMAAGAVAVLSLAGQGDTDLCVGSKIAGHNVVRADDPGAENRVVADTFLRFKGLERPWVVVTELGDKRSRYDVRMHIALTRATVGCVVVATADEIARDARLAAVCRAARA